MQMKGRIRESSFCGIVWFPAPTVELCGFRPRRGGEIGVEGSSSSSPNVDYIFQTTSDYIVVVHIALGDLWEGRKESGVRGALT